MAATIELYLVRHAIAAERGPNYPDDRERPLTSEGIARFKQAVDGLKELGGELDLVLTSPLVRAEHTAELLVAGLPSKPRIEDARGAGARRPVAAVARRRIESCRSVIARIALVGHEPDLGELAAKLLQARGDDRVQEGRVCCIELDGAMPTGPGTLRWLLPPRALRKFREAMTAMARAVVIVNPLSGRGRHDAELRAHAAAGPRRPGAARRIEPTVRATTAARRRASLCARGGRTQASTSSSPGAATARSTKWPARWCIRGVPLAIVPAGSGNGLARTSACRSIRRGALRLAATGGRRRRSTPDRWTTRCSSTSPASASTRSSPRASPSADCVAAASRLPATQRRRAAALPRRRLYSIDASTASRYEHRAMLIAIANGRQYGNRVADRARRAARRRPARGRRRRGSCRCGDCVAAAVALPRHAQAGRGVHDARGARADRARPTAPIPFHVDGEPRIGRRDWRSCTLIQRALIIEVPRSTAARKYRPSCICPTLLRRIYSTGHAGRLRYESRVAHVSFTKSLRNAEHMRRYTIRADRTRMGSA